MTYNPRYQLLIFLCLYWAFVAQAQITLSHNVGNTPIDTGMFSCDEDAEEVVIVDYPKFFTPNNDGFNDYWQIKGIANYPNSSTLIYDRYGILITLISSNDAGWDGRYNGKKMKSSDYWFTTDLGDGRTFSGHFALKR